MAPVLLVAGNSSVNSSRARLTPANRLNTQRQMDLGSFLQNRVVERSFQLGCGLVLAAFSHKKPELLEGVVLIF